MKEQAEIAAIRLANACLEASHKGQLKKLRKLAADVRSHCDPLPMPSPRKDGHASVYIRWLIRRDIPEVLAIEGESYSDPWNEQRFIDNLRRRNCVGMAAEFQKRVVGYMVYDLQSRSLELLNLAVHPEYRKREVGRQLIDKLKGKINPERKCRIIFVVAEKNLIGQLFLQKMGFRAEPVGEGYLFSYGKRAKVE